jgi:hypothetical protein
MDLPDATEILQFEFNGSAADCHWNRRFISVISRLADAIGDGFERLSGRDLDDPVAVIRLVQFLDELDGCSEFRIYRQIVLPLCKPALATLAVFTFMGAWNDFILPLLVVKSGEMRTLTLAVAALSSGLYVMSFPLMMAAATFVIVPVIAAFLFSQRFFTRSIVLGGLK